MSDLTLNWFEDTINKVMRAEGDSDGHLLTIFSMIIALNAKNVLELGVKYGYTTEPMIKATAITHGTLTSVDKNVYDTVKNQFSKYPNWKYVASDSLQFLRSLPASVKYDVVLIDDWHDGLHTLEEIELLSKHITPSSILLLHDTMCRHTEPNYHLYPSNADPEFGNGGPYGTLTKLDPTRWEWATIPVSHGLTIIRKIAVDYTLILTTHKHPKEAGDVMKEIEDTTKGFNKELLVIGHVESDRPIGTNLPKHTFIIQPNKGCANSIWHGANVANGSWFIWLCDDHKYVQRDWLARAHQERLNNPKAKVIKFNAQTCHVNCAQIGMAERAWYLERYPEPVYYHYGWDDEIALWARNEGVYVDAKNVIIKDILDYGRIDNEIKKRDHALNDIRIKTYGLVNGKMAKLN